MDGSCGVRRFCVGECGQVGSVNVRIEGPLSSVAGLGELADLYGELHEVHATVAMYGPLIRDAAASWQLRQCLYEGAVRADVAVYFVARDEFDRAIGYAVVLSAPGPDDTFETRGMLELISLVGEPLDPPAWP